MGSTFVDALGPRDAIEIKPKSNTVLCLYSVQQFYAYFLALISPLSQSSISEVEFKHLNQDFHKLLGLGIKQFLVWDSWEALCCVHEQDTLSSASLLDQD